MYRAVGDGEAGHGLTTFWQSDIENLYLTSYNHLSEISCSQSIVSTTENTVSTQPSALLAVERSFQENWFFHFPWLHYDVHKDAAFCFICVREYIERKCHVNTY